VPVVVPDLRDHELQLELRDAGSLALVRLFRHAGGDWEPPLPEYRKLRVDPPDGQKDEYSVLYTGRALQVVATECGILKADPGDKYAWSVSLAAQYRVVRYAVRQPALFLRLDEILRLFENRGFEVSLGDYSFFQALGLELFRRFGTVVHGLCWPSFHRNRPGPVYALWHHHKETVRLERTNGPTYPTLLEDHDWQKFVADRPHIRRLDPAT
jgi:hypothetical protein